MRRARVCLIMAAAAALLGGAVASRGWALGGSASPTRTTLRRLQGVGVSVEGITPEVAQAGLTREQLETDITLRLRQSGVKVLETPAERSAAPGCPCLNVNL